MVAIRGLLPICACAPSRQTNMMVPFRQVICMPTTSRVVANELIRLAAGQGRSLTPMQLMKLVYIAHGWSLGLDNRPLVTDRIEAWRHGPVLPDLYQQVKRFGAQPIDGEIPGGMFAAHGPPLAPRELDLVRQTYEQYGRLNGIQLSELTHQADTPWSITWSARGKNAPIAPDLIAEHYRRLAHERIPAHA